ncbi:response regulator transcription factor [Pararhodobacter sp. SW119]|uniref:response regulator transcription factor n=1 Tax=Pararhodobacter sp. SW119 TaxID=2780075 RepID=UPI001ADF692D|nr:response regulator transcription factor [Pararhodobacter sp. SW119]
MRILVVEDDIHVAAVLERRLGRDGFNVQQTDTGEEAIDLARHYPFDLVLLDLNLPDIPGQTVLRRLRMIDARIPVMVLSGDDDTETRLRCFELGADDFMVKPCHGDELVARVRAIIRRNNGHVTPTLEIGDLSVDTQAREVHAAGEPVPLTRREYQLLEFLALRRGTTVSKDALLTHMYDGVDEPDAKIIDVYVCKIRSKLADVAPDLVAQIETVWGRGYALKSGEPDVARLAPPPPLAARSVARPSETRLTRVA